ncbi:MAG: hydrogenase maturation protein, partial [Geminicoccaceae bacterium]|nr:hydrogenase maturation protein [Geminicoccaceae bacterium]
MVPLPAGTGANHGDLVDLATISPDRVAVRLEITGVVQGVGFRPYVHRLAFRHGLAGWVRNASGEVQCEVEGTRPAIEAFVGKLREEAPPLARIDQVKTRTVVPTGSDRFTIVQSADQVDGRQPVPPDAAICSACEAELFDPADRRYRYPFITCTDCGPRFTVIEALPYDRERTSMRAFAQCPACQQEYQSPADRRFHSETNSCSACGPRLWFQRDAAGSPIGDLAGLDRAAALLLEGGILALRGLGGFHLAVDATSEAAVVGLRARKHRESKPLAVMVRDLEAARELGVIGRLEE